MHRKLVVHVLEAPAYNSEGQDCPLVCCPYNFILNSVYYTKIVLCEKVFETIIRSICKTVCV